MDPFPLASALLGGLLIGGAAAALFVANGRVAGISGILGGLARRQPGEASWRWAFVAGLLTGGLIVQRVHPSSFGLPPASLPVLALAGLLVGVGTRASGGCTSGHGVCGVGRLSVRSMVATLTFIGTGVSVVLWTHHGGRLP